ncbi:zinc ribbon domain-containing protein [Halalkalicoccus jeotgali]|uniref:DUF7575 domain-containing protein n=1 Tax=Halalkalicoccus jeotgali (strain DSM 18796 / CECT 7217 / JCM 14584 / KCTC 4019 / B3) TaxID=795797 RepID=D8JAK8_HALJB|nr:zinc ribbon domain-containing protein [Halalkalicoccus jeotgali]ADJ14730.1 hypothetical protein HacjB3_06715 [Halalkalicoccus jeotgali B3]ELY39312.1 hypothetical protein C497_05122 [Halalkalicoccus jeotgali B3]
MDGPANRKRPWLAAALAVPVIGFGHIYLRRWKRAFGWLLVVTAVSTLFVPASALESPAALVAAPFREVFPLALAAAASVVDAYLIARRERFAEEIRESRRCPHCARELSAEVGFCEWCGSDLPVTDGHER